MEQKMQTIEKKHATMHAAIFKRAAENGNVGATSPFYQHLLGLNDKRMQKEIKEAFGKKESVKAVEVKVESNAPESIAPKPIEKKFNDPRDETPSYWMRHI